VSTTHTPGPWQLRTGDKAATVYATTPAEEQLPLCTVHHQYVEDDEYAPNARLIAAAPELLAALEEARVALQAEYNRTAARYLVGPLHTVELAIAKAVQS
jgi:hypothetical protein